MANKKHLFVGSTLFAALVLIAVAIFVRSGSAQTVNCSYTASPEPLIINVTAGQTVTVPLTITGAGTDCASDNITVQVWDNSTHVQAVWPWATVNPSTISGGAGTVQISFSPSANLTPTYNPLIRLQRNGNFVQFLTTNLTLTPAPVTKASSVSLSLTPSTITKVNNASGPVDLSYIPSPSTAVIDSLTIQITPPSTAWTTLTTLTNLTGSGTYSIQTNSYTVSGTYGIRACLNTTCTGTVGTEISNMVTFNLDAGTTTTTGCPAGQVWCPAGTNTTAGCYTTCPTYTPTPTTGCAVGERCPSNSWCSNGSQCYYPTGELTCVAWPSSTGTTAMGWDPPACPSGTSECSPTDTSCVAIGQVVPYSSTKWCRNGENYYSNDGANMTCVKRGNPAPAGYTSCRPGDTNCIPIGGYGSSSGWCTGSSMSCYQTASDTNPNNDRYCAPMTMTSTGSDASCPAGYSVCSPTDTNCKQKGDTWTNSNTSYWCSNSQQCALATGGGICVDWAAACPAGTKYCSATDQNCVEPGERKIRSGSQNYWCGGGGMDFHSATEVYCPPKTSSMQMWTASEIKAILNQLGAGFGLCEPGDSQCGEPGEIIPSSGWCAWMPPGSSGPYMPSTSPTAIGTRTCSSLDDGTTPPPPTTCPAGQISCPSSTGTGTYCYAGATCPSEPEKPPACPLMIDLPNCSKGSIPEKNEKGCLTGKCVKQPEPPKPVPCPIPMMPVMDFCPPGQVVKTKTTPDGCPFSYCESPEKPEPPKGNKQYFRMLADQLRGHRFFLKDLERQLKDIEAKNENIVTAKKLIVNGKTRALKIDALIKTKNEKNIPEINKELNILQEEFINELQFLSASFEVYRQCGYLRQDINHMQDELSGNRYEFASFDVKEELNAYRETLNAIKKHKDDVCSREDEFEIQDVWDELNDFRMDFEEFRQELHEDMASSYLVETFAAMNSSLVSLREQFDAKNIIDDAFTAVLKKAEEQAGLCEEHVNARHSDESKMCIDNLQRLFNTLKSFADKYGLEFEYSSHPEDIFIKNLEKKLAKRVEMILGEKMAKLQVVFDEKFQAVAVKLAEITETIKLKTDEIAQAAANVVNFEEKFKKQIEESREKILARIKEVDIKQARQTAVRQALEQLLACAARINWIGQNGSSVTAKIEAAVGLLKTGTLTLEDAQETLRFCESTAVKNQEESFKSGLTAFKDVPTEMWFHGPSKFAYDQGFILGRKDSAGNLTNEFVPTQPTLYGEALAMTMRLCEVPVGQLDRLTAPVSAASPWMYPFVNGAASFGVDLRGEDMTVPITRLEAATLATQVCEKYVTLPSAPVISPTAYKDYSKFRSNTAGAVAIDALTQAGVFQGTGEGKFNPDNNLLRTEMAAVLQRLAENVINQ